MQEIDWTILEPLEYKKALERMGGMEHLYIKFVTNFLSEYSNFPQVLDQLVEQKDEKAYVLTHSLKNISASLGAMALADAAEQMEHFFKGNIFEGNDLYKENLFREHNSLLLKLQKLPLEKQEKAAPCELPLILCRCQRALKSLSTGEIRRCRTELESLEPSIEKNPLVKKLLEALKKYHYNDAKEILTQLEEEK